MKLQHRLATYVCALLILAAFTSPVHAQNTWETLDGLNAGRIFSLVSVDGLGILAGTERGGQYLSTDDGDTWSYHSLANESVRSLYLHSDGRIFAGLQAGMRISTDNGSSWESSGLSNNENAFGVAVNSTGHMFAAGWSYGVNRSTDNGATWEVTSDGLRSKRCNSLAVDDADVLYTGVYSGGLFRSSDNGDSWELADPAFADKNIGSIAVSGSTVFAAVQYLGVYRSTDHGLSWTGSSSGFAADMGFSALCAISATELYAATEKHLYYSADAGDSWVRKSTSPITDMVIMSLVKTPSGRLIVGTDWDGIYISDDMGSTWTSSLQGITNLDVNTLAGSGDGRLYAGHRVGPIMVSMDHGTTWFPASAKDVRANQLQVNTAGTIYSASPYGLLFSADQGTTWVSDTAGMPRKYLVCLAVKDNGDVFVGASNNGCYRKRSGESSWTDVTNELGSASVSCLSFAGSDIFAGTQSSGVFRSTDDGASWTDVSAGLLDRYISSMTYDAGRGLFVGTQRGVCYSTDLGATWTRIGVSDPNGYTSSIILLPGDGVVASTKYNGVFIAPTLQSDWVEVNTGLFNTRVKSLVLDKDGYFYAGTEGNGVFRRGRIVVSAEAVPAAPVSMALSQNYPNPFNPSTTISYSLPAAGQVSLKVYNVIGIEVATLVDAVQDAGPHRATLDAGKLNSGQYFYQLRSGQTTLTRSMTIIK